MSYFSHTYDACFRLTSRLEPVNAVNLLCLDVFLFFSMVIIIKFMLFVNLPIIRLSFNVSYVWMRSVEEIMMIIIIFIEKNDIKMKQQIMVNWISIYMR